LWNLKTGKPIYTLDESDPIFIITFSPNGSQIAGAMYTENAIKVWCTKTKQLLHKLSSSQAITSLSFSHPTGFLLTSRYHNPMVGPMQDQWSLIPSGTKAGELINSSYCFGGRETKSPFSSDQYCASHPCTYLATPTTELHITKKSCASLYLCMQAIHQSGDRSHISKLIECSTSFHSLTDIERNKVYFEMNRK
jgi:WD40 repeat protein